MEKSFVEMKLGDKISSEEKPLQVVFIIDITGSMSSAIEGVKKMVAEFCKIDRPSVKIHIWTYTENSKSCYVSKSPNNLSSEALVDYVNQLKICCPPDFPHETNATGGDGPENVTAAVVSLLESFDPTDNILSFIITDAEPHHKLHGLSSEAQAEQQWLREHNFDSTDVFVLLNRVIEELNVTFVPVLYSNASSKRWYHQAAALSQGAVMCPKANDSVVLARGLGAMLDTIQRFSVTRQVDQEVVNRTAENCQGFEFLQIEDDFVPIQQDSSDRSMLDSVLKRLNNLDDIRASFFGLMETMVDRFKGKKSGKRCRSVDPLIISSSVRVLIMSMLGLINSKLFDAKILNNDVSKLLDLIKDDRETFLINKWIAKMHVYKAELVMNTQPDARIQPVQCVITLESAFDYLNGLEQVPRTEAEVEQWMQIILQLIIIRLIDVKFPLDFYGKTDFADAWAASVQNVELSSVMSASAAIKLRDPLTCTYKDPISRKDNSVALILAHPNDAILALLYKGLTSLPSLAGLIQSYLVSGGIKIFPSIIYGLQASSLWYFLRTLNSNDSFSQSKWETIRCILWSLTNSSDIPASSIVTSLRKGNGFNPVDNISKLIAATVWFFDKNPSDEAKKNIIHGLFQEYSADVISFILRLREKSEDKSKEDNLISDNQMIECFISLDYESFDPCVGFHDSEKLVKKITNLNNEGFTGVKRLLKDSNSFKRTRHTFIKLCELIQSDLKVEDFDKALNNFKALITEDEMLEIYNESFFIKKRTGRYTLDENKNWIRSEDPIDLNLICLENIREICKTKFSEWNTIRKSFARKQVLKQASELNSACQDELISMLKSLKYELLDINYSLDRMDALEILEMINEEKLKTLGVALCIGDWTTQQPSQLRRHVLKIKKKFEKFPDIQTIILNELVKEQVCQRESKNRHGHTKYNPYPGILGWTQEYHDKRLALKSGSLGKLTKMKEFRTFADHIIENVLPIISENRRLLIEYTLHLPANSGDVIQLKNSIERIQELTKLDSEKYNEQIRTFVSIKHKRPRKKLYKFLVM